MFTFRLLTSTDLIALYECFLLAFSDYEVDMQMSLAQFEQRIARDGVQLEVSAGAFVEGKLIGFYMNAPGTRQGQRTVYDAGTGVIPAYRGRGVGKELFALLLPHLKEASVSQYLLEVLTSNQPAVALYRKLGFVESRRLAVLRSDALVKPRSSTVTIRRVEQPDWRLFESFWDGYPSWQNSIEAVERIADHCTIVGAYVDDECAGYGVVLRPAGSLMQLAVAPAHRRRGIGTTILSELQSEPLKVINVDEELKRTLAFFVANGYKTVLEQFEMIRML